MKKRPTLLTIAVLVLFASSCSIVYRTVLGVRSKGKWLTNETLIRQANRLDIPLSNLYQTDTSSLRNAILQPYRNKIDSLKTKTIWNHEDSALLKSWKAEIKDQLQPVQVHYFDKNGKAIYWMINCYVDPVFPKMNWNCEQSLDVFPPRPFSPLNDKFYHDLDFFLPHLRDTANQAPSFNDLPASDYYVLILWNDIFKRPSSSLIHTIQKYNKKQKDVKIHTLYASNHNEYLWTIMDSTNRARVMPLEN